jgi:hypothetical protein
MTHVVIFPSPSFFVTTMAKARIPLPRHKDAPALLALSNLVYAKHQLDGPASPLRGELADKWATLGPKLAQAKADHDRAKELEKELEKLYQDRDLVLVEAEPVIRQSRDLLIGYYGIAKIRNLGDHGFTVNDTPR